MIEQLASRDCVSIVALSREITSHYGTNSINDLAKRLDVSLSTEGRNRKTILERLAEKPPRKVTPIKDEFETTAAKVVQRLMTVTHAVQRNESSPTYAPWFISTMKDLHEEGIKNTDLEKLTGILRSSLARRRNLEFIALRRELSERELNVEQIWHDSPHRSRCTLHKFYAHYVIRTDDHTISRGEMRDILLRLGLRNPRGPKPKNEGVDTKFRWEPHALWAGDGKIVKISINGQRHDYLWYAFADEATTLLVGSVLGDTESAKEVVAALQSGIKNTGRSCIGIVIDNRTVRTDLGVLRDFCRERNIEIVRTFPGNPKSNGIIEGNFAIFENHVSEIKIEGSDHKEIARSIAKEVVEIFTQLRNHKLRKNKGSRLQNDDPLISESRDTRNSIQKLAARLEADANQTERKWLLIAAAREKFPPLAPSTEERLRKFIGKTADGELVIAQAAFLAQCAKYPEKRFDHRYFAAIIRNRRDEVAKAVYVEQFAAGCKQEINLPKVTQSDVEISKSLCNIIADVCQLKTSLRRRLFLESLVYLLLQLMVSGRLQRVWATTLVQLSRNTQVSLRAQQEVMNFLYERIGPKLAADLKMDFSGTAPLQSQATSPPCKISRNII